MGKLAIQSFVFTLTAAWLTGCASGRDHQQASNSGEKKRPRPERAQPKPRETTAVRPTPQGPLNSIQDVVNRYGATIGNLGQAEERDVAGLKEGLVKFLPDTAGGISILTHLESNSGWWAGILVAVTPEGRLFLVNKQGTWVAENMKDRIMGGVYTDNDKRSGLLTLFFSDPTSPHKCHAYWGTQKAEVLQFNVDRENFATLSARVRLPNGKLLNVVRQGRDNKNIQVNGSPLVALFL